MKNGGLPPNLIAANPQFGSAYYISNDSNSTYNSGQVELNKRFANGFQFQTAYVRSKALGDYDGTSQSETAAYYTDRNHHLDKRLLSFDRTNVITSSGVYDVPLGPGKKFLGSTHGVMARIVERWQTAVIFNKFSGSPTTFTDSAGGTFNNTATATAVLNGPIPSGSVHIVGNNVEYFNNLDPGYRPIRQAPAFVPAEPERALCGPKCGRTDRIAESRAGNSRRLEPNGLSRARNIHLECAGFQIDPL